MPKSEERFLFVVKVLLGILCIPTETEKLNTQAGRGMETRDTTETHKDTMMAKAEYKKYATGGQDREMSHPAAEDLSPMITSAISLVFQNNQWG